MADDERCACMLSRSSCDLRDMPPKMLGRKRDPARDDTATAAMASARPLASPPLLRVARNLAAASRLAYDVVGRPVRDSGSRAMDTTSLDDDWWLGNVCGHLVSQYALQTSIDGDVPPHVSLNVQPVAKSNKP